MYISPAEALRIYAVSKPTLYADMDKGVISYTKTEKDKRQINVAELDRVYNKRGAKGQGDASGNVKSVDNQTEINVNQTSQQLERLQQEVEYLKREIQTRGEENEHWREAFHKAQSTADKITALLEDKSAGARQGGDPILFGTLIAHSK